MIDYWIITLPTLLTGLILFRKLKQAREQAQKALTPAVIARHKQGK
jgi:hypothetical protein